MLIITLGLKDRAHLPPAGQIVFLDAIMRYGVYLPLKPYFRRIIEYYNFAHFQLIPNAYRLMVVLYIIFHRLKLGEPQLENFVWVFQIKYCIDFGLYYFNKWVVEGLGGIKGIHDNMGAFKKNFFYTLSRIANNFRILSNPLF